MKIHTLDLLFQNIERTIAAYLLEGPDGWVLIETGPMSTLPTLRERIRQYAVKTTDIKHVLVTHIHLDHAGAAGWWAQQGATVYVHHVGAPHLIDPAKLWRSAGRIYGEQMEILWGEIVPAPADRVVPLDDGDEVAAAGLTLIAHDTPGHAWHHHVFQIGDVAFSGDAAGVRLAPDKWISLPAPPPEFDLQAWRKTIARLKALHVEKLYLTHFGEVHNVPDHFQQFGDLLENATGLVREQMEAGADRERIIDVYKQWNRERALDGGLPAGDFAQRYEAPNPLFMSVDGIMRYWRKKLENRTI